MVPENMQYVERHGTMEGQWLMVRWPKVPWQGECRVHKEKGGEGQCR